MIVVQIFYHKTLKKNSPPGQLHHDDSIMQQNVDYE